MCVCEWVCVCMCVFICMLFFSGGPWLQVWKEWEYVEIQKKYRFYLIM